MNSFSHRYFSIVSHFSVIRNIFSGLHMLHISTNNVYKSNVLIKLSFIPKMSKHSVSVGLSCCSSAWISSGCCHVPKLLTRSVVPASASPSLHPFSLPASLSWLIFFFSFSYFLKKVWEAASVWGKWQRKRQSETRRAQVHFSDQSKPETESCKLKKAKGWMCKHPVYSLY